MLPKSNLQTIQWMAWSKYTGLAASFGKQSRCSGHCTISTLGYNQNASLSLSLSDHWPLLTLGFPYYKFHWMAMRTEFCWWSQCKNRAHMNLCCSLNTLFLSHPGNKNYVLMRIPNQLLQNTGGKMQKTDLVLHLEYVLFMLISENCGILMHWPSLKL